MKFLRSLPNYKHKMRKAYCFLADRSTNPLAGPANKDVLSADWWLASLHRKYWRNRRWVFFQSVCIKVDEPDTQSVIMVFSDICHSFSLWDSSCYCVGFLSNETLLWTNHIPVVRRTVVCILNLFVVFATRVEKWSTVWSYGTLSCLQASLLGGRSAQLIWIINELLMLKHPVLLLRVFPVDRLSKQTPF